jgi:hypothetical protein
VPVAPEAGAGDEPVTPVVVEPVAVRRRGKHAKPDPDESPGERALTGGTVDTDAADAMLAQLAAEEVDGVDRLAGRFATSGRKVALGFFGALAATLVLLLVMLVLGALS